MRHDLRWPAVDFRFIDAVIIIAKHREGGVIYFAISGAADKVDEVETRTEEAGKAYLEDDHIDTDKLAGHGQVDP